MTAEAPELDLTGLEPADARRVRMTVNCHDADSLPKVPGAGQVVDHQGQSVQVMHNGLIIEEGCYFGPWMTEIIRGLRGHHEPQEEVLFHAIVQRLKETAGPHPVIVEFGSFWSYYTMWFCRELAGARGLAIEPDPRYLAIGRRNAALNDLTDRITFTHGAVGPQPGKLLDFVAESNGEEVRVPQYDLATLLAEKDASHVDLAMVDIQGFESVLLPRAKDLLLSGVVRFMLVSTHHQSISGEYLTHQDALQLLTDCGGHIIAEHSISESFSGDGLIAVAFDSRDADFTVPISHARAKESLYGEPEFELARLAGLVAERDASLGHYQRHVERIESELAAGRAEAERLRQEVESIEHQAQGEIDGARSALTSARADAVEIAALHTELGRLRAELASVQATRVWRWSAAPRAWYRRVRSRIHGQG